MKKSLDVQAKKVLDALTALGSGWHSRAELAVQLKRKKRLYPSDVTMLDLLVERGLVEEERREIDTPIPMEYVYRIKPTAE